MSSEGVLQLLEATDWRLPFRARLVDSRIEEWRQLSPQVILALEQLRSSLPSFNEPDRESLHRLDDHLSVVVRGAREDAGMGDELNRGWKAAHGGSEFDFCLC